MQPELPGGSAPGAIGTPASSNQLPISNVNPFVHKLVWDDPIDKIKTALLTVVLLPFRLGLILVCLIVAWLLATIGLYGLSPEELRRKPLAGWRRVLRLVTAFVMRMLFVFGSFGWIRYKGKRASPKVAPVLCVAPHTSFYDSLGVILFGPSSVVAKYETAKLPFFGKLIDYTQPIYVCREDPYSRQRTIREIIQRANSKEDWPQILIFPEGTCTNRTSLIQFKLGAFYPAVPIQPVLMRYPNEVDTVTWTWEGPSAIQLLWRTLTKFHTFCEIEFMPVYYPSEKEQQDPYLYAANVRNLMARALHIPISDYSFDDCKLMTFAKNVNMPYASAMADISKLRNTLGLNVTFMEDNLAQEQDSFNRMHPFIGIGQFANSLVLDQQRKETIELFHIFVKPERPDEINVKDYLLVALFLKSLYKPKIDFLEALFHLYGENGKLSCNDLYDVLKMLLVVSREEVNTLFIAADSNKLQSISFDQFEAVIGSRMQRKLQKTNDPNNLKLE